MGDTRIEEEVVMSVLRLVEREKSATITVEDVVAEVRTSLNEQHEQQLRVFGVSIEHVLGQHIAPLVSLGFAAWDSGTRAISLSRSALQVLVNEVRSERLRVELPLEELPTVATAATR